MLSSVRVFGVRGASMGASGCRINAVLVARMNLSFSASSGDLPAPKEDDQKYMWLKRLFGLTTKSSIRIRNARSIFFNCKHQAEQPVFYRRGLVSTDFRSKQNMIVTHVWMVHKRLIQEGEEGKKLQEELFDQLWQDTMHRIRGMGVGEMSVNKHLKNVQHMSFGLCVSLDEAVKDQTNEHDVVEEIAGCMWRYPYQRREDVDEDRVVALAKYVRAEQVSLQQIPAEALLEGRFAWGPLPKFPAIPKDYKPVANVKPLDSELDDMPASEEKQTNEKEKGEWRTAISATGKIYYWNTVTRESRWEKPKE